MCPNPLDLEKHRKTWTIMYNQQNFQYLYFNQIREVLQKQSWFIFHIWKSKDPEEEIIVQNLSRDQRCKNPYKARPCVKFEAKRK